MGISKVSVGNTKIIGFFFFTFLVRLPQTMVYFHFRNHSHVLCAELVAKPSRFNKNKIYRW